MDRGIHEGSPEFIVVGIFTADPYEYSARFILRARRFLMPRLVRHGRGQGLMKLGEKNANKSRVPRPRGVHSVHAAATDKNIRQTQIRVSEMADRI